MSIQDELQKMIASRTGFVEQHCSLNKDYNGATRYCPRCDKDLPIRAFMSPKSGRLDNYCRPCRIAYQRNREYGFFEEKPVKCAICRLTFNDEIVPRLDHNHVTGTIRGWLCHGCNVMIGHAKENIEILQKAIVYLVKHIQKERN